MLPGDRLLDDGSVSLHRLVTRVALAGSLVAAVALVTVGVVTAEPQRLWEAVGPAAVAVVSAVGMGLRRERAEAVLAAAAAAVVVTFSLAGSEATLLAATLALVVIGSVGSVFVYRRIVWFVIAGALTLAAVPLLWRATAGIPEGPVATGYTMAAGFALASLLLWTIRRAARQVDSRFGRLFQLAPVGLYEQDWGEAIALLRREGITQPADACDRLGADLELLRRVISRVKVVRANDTAGAILEAPPSDLEGYLSPDRAHPGSQPALVDQLASVLEGRPGFEAEYPTHTTRGRPLWVRIRSLVVEEASGSVRVLIAFQDVTEERKAREALTDLVEAKDQFIASVSHELRTPLTGVVAVTEELAHGTGLSEADRVEMMEMLVSQSRELSFLVEDLLVGARAGMGTVTVCCEPLDLVEEAQRVVRMLGGIRFEVSDRDPPVVSGDPVRIRQILRNLVVNAERYGGPDRRLVVGVRDGVGVVEARDRGEPLSPEDRERIFEPYQRAHERSGSPVGVGLGLSVSRQLARLMGGDLEYDHDGEAVFRLSLPLVEDGALIEVSAGEQGSERTR